MEYVRFLSPRQLRAIRRTLKRNDKFPNAVADINRRLARGLSVRLITCDATRADRTPVRALPGDDRAAVRRGVQVGNVPRAADSLRSGRKAQLKRLRPRTCG